MKYEIAGVENASQKHKYSATLWEKREKKGGKRQMDSFFLSFNLRIDEGKNYCIQQGQ